MGGGGALEETAPHGQHQVPRLTTMLRAFATEAGALDTAALYFKRQQALQAKREQQKPREAEVGRSELAMRLLGPWERASRAARELYERYVRGVVRLLGGQAAAAEVQEAGALVWDAWLQHPVTDRAAFFRPTARRHRLREVVQAAVGQVEDHVWKELLPILEGLQALQQPSGKDLGKGKATVSKAPVPAKSITKEFGADLEFHFPRLEPAADEAVLGHSNAAPQAVPSRPASGADMSPDAVRSMFAAASSAPSPSAPAPGPSTNGGRPSYGIPEEELPQELRPKGPQLSKAGAAWLWDWCARVTGSGVSSADAGLDDDDAVPQAVFRLLVGAKSGDEVAAELFDLLGEGVFDHVQPLLQERRALVANIGKQIAAGRQEEAADKATMPIYGNTVSITSESQKLLDRLERKDKRRGAKARAGGAGAAADPDLDWLAGAGLGGLVAAEQAKAAASAGGPTLVFSDGTEFRIGDGGGAAWTRAALPPGTSRKTHKGYEEVCVPAGKKSQLAPGERLVRIEEMEEWAQLAFQGYETLNRIQSRIYPTAFGSNENVLVCAPTGAGKTNIAMMAVLHQVALHMRGGLVDKAAFKVVYVAPMKALAAEVTAAFSKRLAPLGLAVRELTGDMQLSKRELAETQMIVTTPEKWDVITRKGGDVSVAALVRLLIIDEVHLLNDERGPVIEVLVARTQRQVEASQSMIRIVGLSATLPNYKDVAQFLGVNPDTGLFYFDASYRPVPLEMHFVGITDKAAMAQRNRMDEVCYEKVVESLRAGHQAMVFVHSRKDTGKTGRTLMERAKAEGTTDLFDCSTEEGYELTARDLKKSRNKEIQELFPGGIGIHHAGMLRSDRSQMEKAFARGHLKLLCCTATLAWGVNLPAHTVIIKGTQLYDAQKGQFMPLGMLDVQQIFGRAGRPQYEDSGLGIILTQHKELARYLGMLTHQAPIESKFTDLLVDNLNAEIVLGTVTTIREASLWLSYTYLYVRMLRNPLAYGIPWDELQAEPRLEGRRKALVTEAARELERSKMARFDERSGNLYVTELGRVASHFYIRHTSIVLFNEKLAPHMTEAEVLSMMAGSSEFAQLAVREEEVPELEMLLLDACPYEVKAGVADKLGKANILLQAYVSRARVDSFSLTADLMYVASNAPRIARALFEICLRRGWSTTAELCLTLAKAFQLQLWPHQHPLRQFSGVLGADVLRKLEDRGLWMEHLQDMEAGEIGALLRQPAAGAQVADCVAAFPALNMTAKLEPITRTVLRVQLDIEPAFAWRERLHGGSLRWHIWVEDSDNEHIYHAELWTLARKMAGQGPQRLAFTIPIFEPLPAQYYVRAISDDWLEAQAFLELSFKGLLLPERHPPHTALLDLAPLLRSALGNPAYEALYSFSHFNPIQTQAFHTLYHTDENVLLGAPTGSGKTISAELTMLRVFTHYPGQKIIYIAPLKALVRERLKDWGRGLCRLLGKTMVELTGDYTPDVRALLGADIIIATPEKWDGISRAWQNRGYVTKVCLLIIDEIHLLGADRGPILEVIVSRMRYIAAQTSRHIRFVGLSTALANAVDLADWLGIKPQGLFNFKPSVRPVPLECHIQGYPGKFYCPRMATMNKPAYAAIQAHSSLKPVLVFVSSRRQTRLTALDLIAYAAADERPRQFVHLPEEELEAVLATVQDANLRHTLQFGIGLHHAGLGEGDREAVEGLFVKGAIQVLVATSTLAWGVNTPAHLVIIKGTEYFDAPSRRYVDFPITDVLQMMGRAGRPQYDTRGVAVIMVHEPKKAFYKKFLYEPFPVESSLRDQVADHLNAEIVGGTVASRQDAVDYLTWTFFYRRLAQNPSYYHLEDPSPAGVSAYLSGMVEETLQELAEAGCVQLRDEEELDDGSEAAEVAATGLGRICSFYYLRHETMAVFTQKLRPAMAPQEVLAVLCEAAEYDELPVRHNEDRLNAGLAREVRFPPPRAAAMDDPHVKAQLLLQAHLGRLPAPISDYVTDTKSTLDNSLRVLQALVDVAADMGWLGTTLAIMGLVQAIMQACWWDEPGALMLPGVDAAAAGQLAGRGLGGTQQLAAALAERGAPALQRALAEVLGGAKAAQDAVEVVRRLPRVAVKWRVAAAEGGAAAGRGAVEVELRREGGRRGGGAPRVYAPRFPKIKEEGWWLVVGDEASQELHAVKRLSFGDRAAARLAFALPPGAASPPPSLTLYLLSDSYPGLDQRFSLGDRAGAGA